MLVPLVRVQLVVAHDDLVAVLAFILLVRPHVHHAPRPVAKGLTADTAFAREAPGLFPRRLSSLLRLKRSNLTPASLLHSKRVKLWYTVRDLTDS